MKQFFKEVFDNIFGGFILSDLIPLLIGIPYNLFVQPIAIMLIDKNTDLKELFEYWSEQYNSLSNAYDVYRNHTSLMVCYSLSRICMYLYTKYIGKKLSKISNQLLKEQEI